MKIAYCRFNQPTDLDYALGSVSSLGTELRVGIMEAMVELGHDVTVVSYVPAKQHHVFSGKSVGDFDNSWMTALKYNLDADIQDYDLLFVETAAGNSMYSFTKDGQEKSFVGHFADVLRRSQGVPILVYQHGPKNLSFPFSRLSCLLEGIDEAYLETLSPNNYRNLFRDIDIWNGYQYTVWHHAPDKSKFLEVFSNYYGRPEVKISKFVSSPMAYSPRYDKLYKPRKYENVDYDLVFVGATSTPWRIERVKRFYDSKWYDSRVVGKGWDEVDFQHGVDTPGRVGFHGDAQKLYLDGQACVLIAGDDLSRCGLATTRHIQTIRGGTFTMIDDAIYNPKHFMGTDEFVVEDDNDVMDMLEEYCDDYRKLVEVVRYQRSLLQRWADVLPTVLQEAL